MWVVKNVFTQNSSLNSVHTGRLIMTTRTHKKLAGTKTSTLSSLSLFDDKITDHSGPEASIASSECVKLQIYYLFTLV